MSAMQELVNKLSDITDTNFSMTGNIVLINNPFFPDDEWNGIVDAFAPGVFERFPGEVFIYRLSDFTWMDEMFQNIHGCIESARSNGKQSVVLCYNNWDCMGDDRNVEAETWIDMVEDSYEGADDVAFLLLS